MSHEIEGLGEGIHTAFRKASDCDEATQVWRLINRMPPEEWGAVVDFVADGVGPAFAAAEARGYAKAVANLRDDQAYITWLRSIAAGLHAVEALPARDRLAMFLEAEATKETHRPCLARSSTSTA